jgi:hypothetical protein
MIQVVYLTSFFIGIGALLSAVFFARLNRRPDIEPYSKQTRVLHMALHPNQYVQPDAVPKVCLLTAIGAVFLLIAMGALVSTFIQDLAPHRLMLHIFCIFE